MIDNSYEHLSKILNQKKIKYSKLNELFEGVLNNKNRKNGYVNVYIDLKSVFKQLYSPETIEVISDIRNDNRIVVASEVLNMIAHYRHYFASRHQMYTRIVFYYSFNKSKYHLDLEPEYNNTYYEKRCSLKNPTFGTITNLIVSNIKLIKEIIKYIPSAYFINSGTIDLNLIPSFFMSEYAIGENDLNLILSNDTLYLQDLANFDNTLMLEMRGSEKSKLIYKDDIYRYLFELGKSKTELDDFTLVPTPAIQIIDCIVGHKDYNLEAVGRKGYITAIKMLEKNIKDDSIGILKLFDINIDNVEEISRILFKKEEDTSRIIEKFKLVNHKYILDMNYKEIKDIVESQLIDMNDIPGLKEVNEKIFAKHPLTLEFMFEGI